MDERRHGSSPDVERIKARLLTHGWSVANDSPLAVLCAVPPNSQAAGPAPARHTTAVGHH